MKKTLIIGATILAVTIGQPVTVNGGLNVVSAATNEQAKFSDVKGHWAQNEIEFLAEKGVIN
ncbi:S-layer homology domain-containing protein, partial [Cytobacillus sp. IB215316]|uniref:S-layer homology domain-containing protein n=1 Tax=Cytobacillus sp. IB215316 TaxID=3097354 RepID=UPI002A0E8999